MTVEKNEEKNMKNIFIEIKEYIKNNKMICVLLAMLIVLFLQNCGLKKEIRNNDVSWEINSISSKIDSIQRDIYYLKY